MIINIKPFRNSPDAIKHNLLWCSFKYLLRPLQKLHKTSDFILSTKDIADKLNCSYRYARTIIQSWIRKKWCDAHRVRNGWMIKITLTYTEQVRNTDIKKKIKSKYSTKNRPLSVDNYCKNAIKHYWAKAKNGLEAIKRRQSDKKFREALSDSHFHNLLLKILDGTAKYYKEYGQIISGISFFRLEGGFDRPLGGILSPLFGVLFVVRIGLSAVGP